MMFRWCFNIICLACLIVLTLNSCQSSRRKEPSFEFRINLTFGEVNNLNEFVSDQIINKGKYNDIDLAFSSNILLRATLQYIEEGQVNQPLTIILRPTINKSSKGTISWNYVDRGGREHQEEKYASPSEVEALLTVIQEWQRKATIP